MQSAFHSHEQHTVARVIQCEGIGLHSGEKVTLAITPAEPDTGIVFKRTDESAPISYIPARYDHVTDTMLGTTITNEHGVAVSTIEHLMAALWGSGVDNAYIELSSPEVPIMDGSAEPFLALLAQAGVVPQGRARLQVRVLKKITVEEGGSAASLSPSGHFALSIEIDFAHKAISHMRGHYDFSAQSFAQALGAARTFGFAHEVEKMRSLGLARGGSLDNAIVIGEDGILNEGGLRFTDEFVRHKALDCVGDFFLAGHRLLGEVNAVKPGHGINNKLMRALFADRTAWRYENAPQPKAGVTIKPAALRSQPQPKQPPQVQPRHEKPAFA